MGTTWAQPTMQCRCASIPITRSTLARPAADVGQVQSIGADLIRNLNDLRQTAYPQDSNLAARTAAYELAFRMQRSVPALLDFSRETAETRALYGRICRTVANLLVSC